MLIYFPEMHYELLVTGASQAVVFNPLGDKNDNQSKEYVLDNPPLKPTECRELVNSFIAYGESLGDMMKVLSSGFDGGKDQFGERSSAIQTELNARLNPKEATDENENILKINQILLALLYIYEEKDIESKNIEQSLNKKWQDFGKTIGLDDSDPDSEEKRTLGGLLSNLPVGSGSNILLPWQKVLEGFAAVLPDDVVLVVTNEDYSSILRDRGFNSFKDEAILGGQCDLIKQKAYEILGIAKCPESKPWLNREITVALT